MMSIIHLFYTQTMPLISLFYGKNSTNKSKINCQNIYIEQKNLLFTDDVQKTKGKNSHNKTFNVW